MLLKKQKKVLGKIHSCKGGIKNFKKNCNRNMGMTKHKEANKEFLLMNSSMQLWEW